MTVQKITAMIFTNSDIDVIFTITDQDGAAIDLSSVSGLSVFLYLKKTNILQSYDLADINIVDAAQGICSVIFDRANNFEAGKLFAEIAVETVDANYAGGTKVSRESDILVGTIQKSVQ